MSRLSRPLSSADSGICASNCADRTPRELQVPISRPFRGRAVPSSGCLERFRCFRQVVRHRRVLSRVSSA
eukprot:8322940-Alexandrium_andersonii.AAC.1